MFAGACPGSLSPHNHMATLVESVDRFESIGGISMEKHLLATANNATVKNAFRTFDIAVPGKGWAAVMAEVEDSAQNVFDDCESMIFDGLPLKVSEPNTAQQVFIAAIRAVLVTSKGKNDVPKTLNNLLVEVHKSTRDLRGLPPPGGQLDLVIGQLFRRIITVLAYVHPRRGSRFSLSAAADPDVVKRTVVQEELHHIRWLVDDLQWGFGDFSVVFTGKLPPSSTETHLWPWTEFLYQAKGRIQELHGSPGEEGEPKRFQDNFGRLIEVLDGLAARLCGFEERILGNTYDEVDRLLQATKASKSSLKLATNTFTEVSRCLSVFTHASDTPKNKVALARSIVIALSILQMLSSSIQGRAAHLAAVSAISKTSVLDIDETSSLDYEGIARVVGDLKSLTDSVNDAENVKGQGFASMWEKALKRYQSLTSTDLRDVANAPGAETIEDLQKAIDQNQFALVRSWAKGTEMRQALQTVLGFLHSFAGAIGKTGTFGAFFPSKAIAASVKAVLDACSGITNLNDIVLCLFKDLDFPGSLGRLKIPMTSQLAAVPDLQLVVTEMLCQFLIVMGTAHSILRRNRINRFVNYLARSPDVIANEVREFERICYNVICVLAGLIFEATYSSGGQHLAAAPSSVLAEAGPSISTALSLYRDRDATLIFPPVSAKYAASLVMESDDKERDQKRSNVPSFTPSPMGMVSSPTDSEPFHAAGTPISLVARPVQPTTRISGHVRAWSTTAGLKILCLDGGGVRGLAEILVLKEILERLSFDLDRELKPSDVFDVIVGTGTGGLIALLFGRLELSIQQAVEVYCEIFQAVYQDMAVDDGETIDKKTQRFEQKVKEIVERFTKSSETKMLSTGSPCKTSVCAIPEPTVSHARLFRSYRARVLPTVNCAIWEAARATTSIPAIFSRIKIGPSFLKESFASDGLRCNNPTMELIQELKDNLRDSGLSCLVSIGAGKPSVVSLKRDEDDSQSSMEKTLLAIATDCEQTAEAASKHFEDIVGQVAEGSGPYWRFNSDQGLQGISNVEWDHPGEMASHVNSYLAGNTVRRNIDELVDCLAKHPRLLDPGLR
ncbi:acyl transferase/acyl hydrolase/lysophospholipase [Flagelloscypha sp. PMI_526]|nr:acyl transferase/acyl hydrolase/lysophospholipase [Flagelloscypha sp. PMI_526]